MDHLHAANTLAVERYLLDEMTDVERDAFEEHFFSCRECGEDLRAGATMLDAARAGLIGAPVTAAAGSVGGRVLPLPPQRRPWHKSLPLSWAAAATFAIAAGYAFFIVQPPAPGSAGPLVLSPATLRPAARGQGTVVSPGPGGVVTLAVDLGGRFTGMVRYELRSDQGPVLASGEAPAPQAGAPLLLFIPSGILRPEERYVLSVHDSGNESLTQEDYRFTVGSL